MSFVRTVSRRLASLVPAVSFAAAGLAAACAVGTSSADLSTQSDPTEPDASGESLEAPAPGSSGGDAATDASTKDASTKDTGAKTDSGSGGTSGSCTGYATPTQPAGCNACGTKPCQANGCYNGYYCNLSTSKCSPKPSSCP